MLIMRTRFFHISLMLTAVLAFAGCGSGLTRYVNPMVGTDFHGHTFPGAITPFGQIQPSPDTRLDGWDGCSAYHYSDDTLYGFSHTHLSGTGCSDFGDVLLMPVMSEDAWHFSADMPQEEYLSRFGHRGEKAAPGYYRVVLDRNRIMAELTTTQRVACHRYTFPCRAKKGFVIDLRHRDKVIAARFERSSHDGIITGWRESDAWNPDQKCYFALRCDQPVKKISYYDHGMKALVELDDDCPAVEVYVAISGVDCEGAVKNLATLKDDFATVHANATKLWEETLSKIEVEGGSTKERRNFYTALYHCYTSPYLWSDVDGRYRGMDDSIYTSETPIYTVFSLWDTYRALHPLMTILEPRTTEAFVNTMLRQYEAGGELTMWELAANETHCMIGYHSVPVILEAQRAGLLDKWPASRRFALLQAMVATSNRTEAHQAYAVQGYLDSQQDNESVSKTLEYAYDDWCIAQYAKREAERNGALDSTQNYYTHIAREYMRRAQSWTNIMDPQGFMHARRNGGFVTPFDPTEVNNHYTEANSWQYSSYVPHDVPAWIGMMGGKQQAEAFLDSLFLTSSKTSGRDQSDITGMIGQYAHGNEPSHHAAYLYAYLGSPDKMDKMVHQILDDLYTPDPDGLCGNEDCGQMSAWYVMSAMGFYPVCPGSGEYVTCTPVFDKVTIHREGQEDLVVEKKNWQPGLFWRDGEFYDTPSEKVAHDEHATPVPYFNDWQQSFEDSVFVTLAVAKSPDTNVESRIYYTTNGVTPDTNCNLYTSPILVNRDMLIRAVAYNPAYGYSAVVDHQMTRFIADKRLRYISQPAPQYVENGPQGLIDRLYGTTNYRIGGWQGWSGDMEVVVDLLQSKTISSVGVDCLENMRSWIFFPSKIEVSVSNDGKHFTHWATVENKEFPAVRERQEETVQHTFSCSGSYTSARYVRIKAHNYGPMPEWHVSAGETPWVFVDEVVVNSYVPVFVNTFGSSDESDVVEF